MQIVPIDSIQIKEDRWRRDFKEQTIIDIADSIERLGLMHAPLCRKTKDGLTLIAGETRIRSMKLLHEKGSEFSYEDEVIPKDYVPVICTSELSDISAKEAELEENIKRKPLSWKEEAFAIAELHRLGAERNNGKQTYKKTAEEAFSDGEGFPLPNSKLTRVREDLLLNAHSGDDEVGKAKTREEALKIIKKKLDREHREKLSKEFQLSSLRTSHDLLKGDMLEIMPQLPSGKFDCIISDPPYGVNANKWNNQSAVKHKYIDDEDYSNKIMECLAFEGHRITKLKAHAYIFCDITRFEFIKSLFEAHEWYVWKWPLIWYRGENSGILPRPDHGPRRTYEAIVYCIKNERKVTKVGALDLILNAPHKRELQYGAQKPPELYEDLISRSCMAGDYVIDPCCGTGPIFPAAHKTNTIATGIERDDEGYAYSYARLRSLTELVEEIDGNSSDKEGEQRS